jgi:hypothetical protein
MESQFDGDVIGPAGRALHPAADEQAIGRHLGDGRLAAALVRQAGLGSEARVRRRDMSSPLSRSTSSFISLNLRARTLNTILTTCSALIRSASNVLFSLVHQQQRNQAA